MTVPRGIVAIMLVGALIGGVVLGLRLYAFFAGGL